MKDNSFNFFRSTNCCSRKWQSSYLTVQNTNFKLYSKQKTDSDFEELNLENSKLIFDVRIEDCLIYYGMNEITTHSSDSGVKSPSPFSLRQAKETINSAQNDTQFEPIRENCLTIYNLKSNRIYVLCFDSKPKTLKLYLNLLKSTNSFSENWYISNSFIEE